MLGVDDTALLLMAGAATIILPALALLWRPLVIESFDPEFMRAAGGPGATVHLAFLALVVLAVVSGFTALGTLMSVGLIMLPAIAARHVAVTLGGQCIAAAVLAAIASLAGLLLSYHADIPAGPAIVLTAGALWLALLVAGPRESLLRRLARHAHYAG